MSDILFRSARDPLFGFSREEFLDYIRRTLEGRVKAAFSYGSYAREEMRGDSDIDLIVVTETDLPYPVRGRLFDDLRSRVPSLEILVYTPEEFASLTEDPSPGFWTSVVKEMARVV